VNHGPATVSSVTSLSGKRLQYLLLNEARPFSNWPGGTDQQIHVSRELLQQVISPDSDTGTLENYAAQIFIAPQNEKTSKKLASEVRTDMTGPTRLYEAVAAGASWLAKQPSNSDERKVMFLVCDGKDTESRVPPQDAIKALQKASVPLFVLAPVDVEGRTEGKFLREISQESGGRAYFLPPNTKHLTLDQLKRDLADSFLLTLSLPSERGLQLLNVTIEGHSQTSIFSSSHVFVP
jgi:hypothetical protein